MGLERAKIGLCGAAPVSPDVLKFFYGIGIRVKEVYGQTESTLLTTIFQGNDYKFGTVGKPCEGTEIKIAEDGEIMVKGPGVFLGYLKDSDSTSEALKAGWLYTGDVGSIVDGGYLRITDRKKDIAITSAGKNIAPQFIENQLKFSSYIHDAIVIADGRPFPTALIMLDEENVIKYAQDNKISFTTYKSLAVNEEVKGLIAQEIERVNEVLSSPEKIKKFGIIDVQLTVDDDEMTSTLKLKRKKIVQRFEDMVKKMYSSRKLG
jgi:long-chain acyl-CoA synthetase